MGKVFVIFGMVLSSFAAHWAYGEFTASRCQDSVDSFREAYKKQRGNPNRAGIAKVLKAASKHCEAGEVDEANRLLQRRAMVCRMSDDC